VTAFLVVLSALLALVAALRRRRERLPARALIVSPRKSTVVAKDGTVTSVQSAELLVSRNDLERLWNPTNLENLGRTYWRFLSRVTLGLIRVVYGEHDRSVVFLFRPITLLRFDAPEYLLESEHGQIRWKICDGLLVARRGRGCGYLALDVRREDAEGEQAKLHIEAQVANFYPAIAAGFSMPVYEATQSSIHVLVTHAFLRSLATLDLAESRVGKMAALEQQATEAAAAAADEAKAASETAHAVETDGAAAPAPEAARQRQAS
jgi:hypothetical protein